MKRNIFEEVKSVLDENGMVLDNMLDPNEKFKKVVPAPMNFLRRDRSAEPI
jgi:hypothetical protein